MALSKGQWGNKERMVHYGYKVEEKSIINTGTWADESARIMTVLLTPPGRKFYCEQDLSMQAQ